MYLLKLVLRNALRRRLRTALTVLGLVIAVVAFGLLQTVVDAWYAGAEGASAARLITRNSISLVFPLPLTYREKLRRMDGVRVVAAANWFGGIYKEPKNFFPQFAVDPAYFDLYPEYRMDDAGKRAFLRERKGAVVGRKLAQDYGFRVGDPVTLKGTIFPGNWEFVVRAIYDGRDARTDTSQFFFHWDYLNETVRKTMPRRADQVGLFVLELSDPQRAAEVSRAVDAMFRNSRAETLTETERAFQMAFVSMTEAIVVAIRVVSFLVIFIILAVMANTMAMTARERLGEYATLKALGFGPGFLALLIYGESLAMALGGGLAGMALTWPVAGAFRDAVGSLFPVFEISPETVALQLACAVAVGAAAALVPAWRATHVGIVEGLRSVG
ncbi:MAG: ABC transporter permease [Betaproteobacteria bacterium]|nr:ABC transporter permease [Betaproteobacteria bacterium]